jgi:hypothetical protein
MIILYDISLIYFAFAMLHSIIHLRAFKLIDYQALLMRFRKKGKKEREGGKENELFSRINKERHCLFFFLAQTFT